MVGLFMPARLLAASRGLVFGTAFAAGAERMPAAASRYRVRVVNAEAAAHETVHEVNGRAAEVHDAGRVNVQAYALLLDQGVELFGLIDERHAVLQPRTAATGYEY